MSVCRVIYYLLSNQTNQFTIEPTDGDIAHMRANYRHSWEHYPEAHIYQRIIDNRKKIYFLLRSSCTLLVLLMRI